MALKKTESTEKAENKESEGEMKMDPGMQHKLLEQIQALELRLNEVDLKASAGSGNSGGSGTKELIEAFTKALDSRGGQSDQFDTSGYVSENTIDKDDILAKEDYVRFYAHVSTYIIVDDLRNGRPVQTPFKNDIKLDYTASTTIGSGKTQEREHMCVYTCKSKKEAKWLKEHSLYGIMFYSSGEGVVSVNSKKATQMATLMKNLMAQDKYQILEACKQHGIEMREDVSQMRMALANKMVEDVAVLEVRADENRIKEMVLEDEEFQKHN